MDIHEIRRAHLRELTRERGSKAKLAKLSESSPAYISQVLSETTKANVGDDLARRIERAYGKPRGWMDQIGTLEDRETAARVDVPPAPVRRAITEDDLLEAFALLRALSEGAKRVAIAQIKALADLDSEKLNSAPAENATERDTVASRTYAENVSKQRQRLKSTLEGGVNRAGTRHKSGGG
ncbi:hypothetical protein [Cupriavidus necator]|uniref:hypothetical protein n=1 Tax=Cupriavidus necator TaxID=106590 RepID=UPI00068DD97E|nr:hypothetical protein [Cupriavidus necator]